MRRAFVALAVMLVAVALLTFPAFAAVDEEPSFVGGIVEAVGGFFDRLFTNIIEGLRRLFIPPSDYFPRAFKRMQTQLNAKFGGFLSSIDYLNKAFKNLKAYRKTSTLFTIKFPKNHLFSGSSVNLLQGSENIAAFIRSALSGICVLFTVAFAYKRVTAMINT